MSKLGRCATCGKGWEYNVSGNKFILIPKSSGFDAYTLLRGIRNNRDTDCCIVKIFARLSDTLDFKSNYAFCNKKNKVSVIHTL